MSDPPCPTPPKPPPTLHYRRPTPQTMRHDGGAREAGCAVGAVLPILLGVLANLFGSFVWNGVRAVSESPVRIGLCLAAAAGLAWLVYAADRRRRDREKPGYGFIGGRFALGCSIALAVWLLLIGCVILAVAAVCGWRP